MRPPAEQLERWRACERRVQRAWEDWLAATAEHRDACFAAYLRALSGEAQAALDLERATAAGSGTAVHV